MIINLFALILSLIFLSLPSQALTTLEEAQASEVCQCSVSAGQELNKSNIGTELLRWLKSSYTQREYLCDFSNIPTNSDNPYQACYSQKNTDQMFAIYQLCLQNNKLLLENGPEIHLLKRELARTILGLQIFYLSRNETPDEAWEEFKKNWKKWAKENPEIIKLDANPNLGLDRCYLSSVIGEDCGNVPGINLVPALRSKAQEGAKNREAGRKIPMGLAYRLIEADLLAKQNPDARDFVYKYYPELSESRSISRFSSEIESQYFLGFKIKQKLKELGNNKPSFDQIKLAVDQTISEEFNNRPLNQSIEGRFEKQFYKAQKNIMNFLSEQLAKAKNNKWLLEQDYILAARLKEAKSKNLNKEAGALQTLICRNVKENQISDSRELKAEVTLGAIGILTGAGAMIESAGVLGAALLGSSLSAMTMASGINIYKTAKDLIEKSDIFYMQGNEYSDIKNAQVELTTEIPWALVNFALFAPIKVISEIDKLKQTATLAKDMDKLKKLERLKKIVVATTSAANIGVSYPNVKAGIQAAIDLIKSEKTEGLEFK